MPWQGLPPERALLFRLRFPTIQRAVAAAPDFRAAGNARPLIRPRLRTKVIVMDKKKLFLVSLGHLSCDINGGALPAILPFLIAAYGFDYQASAGFMFAFSCLSSIIQPAFGYLSDRLSKPWFIPVGVLLAGGGLASIGFLHSYWAIFTAWARPCSTPKARVSPIRFRALPRARA